MPVSTLPIPAVAPGNVLTSTNWNAIVKDNLNKLLNTGHRSLTVAQFGALTGLEGTAGTVAGDEVYLIVDATNGILWHLVYESGETTYKWRFLGGPPMYAVVATAENITNAVYGDLATVGPAIIAPRGGDFDVDFGCEMSNNTAGVPSKASPKAGAAAVNDADMIRHADGGAANQKFNAGGKPVRFTGLSASDTIKIQYASGAGTGTFNDRRIFLRPVRII